MSAASILAQLAPMAAPSGDGMSAVRTAEQATGSVFAGLLAAESLATEEASQADAAEGPVEAAAVDASQALMSSGMLLALQPRPAPTPLIPTATDAETDTSEGERRGFSGRDAAGDLSGPMEPAEQPSASPMSSAADTRTELPGAASKAAAALPGASPAVETAKPAMAAMADKAEIFAPPERAKGDADVLAAKAVVAAQQASAPSLQATPSAALTAAMSAAATAATPALARPATARPEAPALSNASTAKSAENAGTGEVGSTAAGDDALVPVPSGVAPSGAAGAGSAQGAATPSGAPTGGVVASQPDVAAALARAETPLEDPGLVPLPGSGAAPAAPAGAAPTSVNAAAFSTMAQASVDTTVLLAAQITRRLEGRSTRFEIGLTPEGLGRVDVKLDIDAGGRLTARLAFDNPLAATELRGRADELRRELQDAGFDIAHDGLEFSERQSSSSGQAFDQQQGRAFAGAARLNDEADLPPPAPTTWMSLNLTPRGVDMKV